ncbi:MAG: OmpA family protein [Brevundimonas sp.]|uniref:OmpA family protein n=1 Tax=Brevundimonas sp. TaxID=1871086 RepID=UPI003919C3A9
MKVFSSLAAATALLATPAAAHEFRDYFAHGRTELSPAGYRMVRSVAAYARTGRPTRILIDAHMDTAEAAEFSDELSRRRAQAVASELVILGVDPAPIVVQGRGASAPARPTPPNTAEPLNRRVTVGIYF